MYIEFEDLTGPLQTPAKRKKPVEDDDDGEEEEKQVKKKEKKVESATVGTKERMGEKKTQRISAEETREDCSEREKGRQERWEEGRREG